MRRSETRMLSLVLAVVLFGGFIQVAAAAAPSQYVVIVIDDSGSMADRSQGRVKKIDAAKNALATALSNLQDDAQVGVLALNTRTSSGNWIIPLGPLDRSAAERAIRQIRASGGTPLGRAMKVAADALLQQRKARPYGQFRLLVVSDGEAQDQDQVDRFLPDIKGRGLMVDVIGVAMDQDHSLATQVDRYRRAGDEASLAEAIRASLAETSGGNDTQEAADFELLQALPDEMAGSIIESLTSQENAPIGEGSRQIEPLDVSVPVKLPVPGNPYHQPPPSPSRPRGSRIAFIAVFVVLMLVAKSVMRGARHRR